MLHQEPMVEQTRIPGSKNVGKKSKMVRLNRTEQQYVTNSSEFTAETTRFGLAGVHKYIETMGKSVAALRRMIEEDQFSEAMVIQEMNQVMASVQGIEFDIIIVNNSLVRYVSAGRDTHLFNGVDITTGDSNPFRMDNSMKTQNADETPGDDDECE